MTDLMTARNDPSEASAAAAIAQPVTPPPALRRKLRILTVVEPSGWTQEHITGSLRAMGHDVLRFDQSGHVAKFYGGGERLLKQQRNAELRRTARELAADGGLDLIFCYVYDDFLELDTARTLFRLDVPLVNYNVDMANQWYRQIRTAKYFTRMLCAQRANMANLARYRARVSYFPMASRYRAPEADDGLGETLSENGAVTFVGTPTPYRTKALASLLEAGIPLDVYGKYWTENRVAMPERTLEKTLSDAWHYGLPRLRAEGAGGMAALLRQRFAPRAQQQQPSSPALPASCLRGFADDADLSRIFNAAPINLGFTRMTGDENARNGLWQVKLRDFEVPLAGGFYLVERAPDHDTLFRIGEEIETWSTFGELAEKARYYLANDSKRQEIAAAGQRRALRDHTWQARFEGLFKELGI